jgi:hypothetical protein
MKTVTELLAAWDSGKSIWSIEMGGLGPGYEQAIQICAVEFSRVGKDFAPTGNNDNDSAAWERLCSERLKEINTPEAELGLSGAQFSAAAWLAWKWCHGGGPENLVQMSKKQDPTDDRSIQVSRQWPKAPIVAR